MRAAVKMEEFMEGDFRLYYTEQGSGEALVLLHGNGEDDTYFSQQTAYFSQYFRVIAVDTRGHGKSPRGNAPFTLTQFAEDLKVFLDALNLRRVLLLGFSDGGNIALLFTLKYPQYVRKLILNGANLCPRGVRACVQVPICIGYGICSFFALFSGKAKANQELLRLMVKEPHIPPEALGSLSLPVLVIAGTRDMIRRRHTRQIAAAIPGSVLCFIDGDHFIARNHPEAFHAAADRFLRSETVSDQNHCQA